VLCGIGWYRCEQKPAPVLEAPQLRNSVFIQPMPKGVSGAGFRTIPGRVNLRRISPVHALSATMTHLSRLKRKLT
jgi:hypothetical protein